MTDPFEGPAEDGEEESEEVLNPRRVTPIRDVSDEYVFRFEVGPAILMQLQEKLTRIPEVPMEAALQAKYPGFYQLILEERPVYIGKTSRPIGTRLREHLRKLHARVGIDLQRMTCRYAYVEDPSLVDVAEGALIAVFAPLGLADWNQSGFGSKVTGYGRGGQGSSIWAEQYPPNFGVKVTAGSSTPRPLKHLVVEIASHAPLTLSIPKKVRERFDEDHPGNYHYESATRVFEEWITILEGSLNPGWHLDRQAMSWYIVPRYP